MTLTKDIAKRAKFFEAHAGYCTPPGRVACALALAHDEQWREWAEAQGLLSIEWVYDNDYEPWDDETDKAIADGKYVVLGCIVTYREPVGFSGATRECDASLWGIVVESMDDPYCRVIEAELVGEVRNAR